MGQFSDMALFRVLQLWTRPGVAKVLHQKIAALFHLRKYSSFIGVHFKTLQRLTFFFSFDTFSPDTDPLLVNKRHFQGNVSKPQSQNKHVGYTADINLMSLLSVQAIGYTLKGRGIRTLNA